MAASAAATVKTIIENKKPIASFKKIELKIKIKLIENNANSIDNKVTIILRKLKIILKILITKIKKNT
jgi:hypothetical protein